MNETNEKQAEREAFISEHQYLDLTEARDAWDRVIFKHSHVEAMWKGWMARASTLNVEAMKRIAGAPVAQGLTLPQMEMLRALLVSIRPEYGTPGSRDVEVGRQQKRIDAALAILAQAAPSASAQPAKLDADLLTTIREAAAKKAEGAITKDGCAVFINYGDSEQQMLDGAEMACPHCGGSGHKDDVRPVASPAALTAGDQQTLKLIYDAMSMGTGARTLANLLACIENVKHHADCIDAVEREFFMVPGEPDEDDPDSEPGDECLLNRWGSTVEQYVEQFRSAIPHLLAASPADQVNPHQFDVMQSLENIQLPMEGYDPKQPGYERRKGWNDACRYAMDVFRANGIKPMSSTPPAAE